MLTAVESVWAVHEEHHGAAGHEVDDSERELTALLVRYASPLAAAILPRYVNANSQMQAASPAYETARLFSIVGVATDVLRAFALVLVLSAGLSVFVALYHALEERRYDLAIMRTLGASRGRVMTLMLFEAVLLALAGAAIGIAAGHLAAEAVGQALRAARQVEISGGLFLPEELWLFALAAGEGVLAGALPAGNAEGVIRATQERHTDGQLGGVMSLSGYFDYNATTPICDSAVRTFDRVVRNFGNPSSKYGLAKGGQKLPDSGTATSCAINRLSP